MRVVYSPRYHLDFGAHVFPTAKYHAVAARLEQAGVVAPGSYIAPVDADWSDLALAHAPSYLEALRAGTLSAAAIARLEIPYSREIVDGFRFMTGGSVVAARLALDGTDRTAVHLGGGFHHAFAGHGEGFCMFNDVAVAILVAFRDRLAASAAVVDLDVHHGNGTAAIFADDARVFTLSVHEQDNYPEVKPRGSLDLGLARRTGARIFAGVEAAGWHFPDEPIDGIAVLPDEHELVWRGHRQQHHRPGMPHHIHHRGVARRQRHAIG